MRRSGRTQLQKSTLLTEIATIDEARAEELRAEAQAALTDSFKPSYDALIAWMNEDMPNADEIATGVWKLPEGRDFYAERLAFATTTDMTPDEVHELGLSEVVRIRGEMETVKDAVGFEGSLGEFFTFMREDPKFYYPNTDEGREAYLQAARDHLAFIGERLPDYFGLLPQADIIVKRVEAFREQGRRSTALLSRHAGWRAARHFLCAFVGHELNADPAIGSYRLSRGQSRHHMQISIAQELESVPEFRTQSFFNGVYRRLGALF